MSSMALGVGAFGLTAKRPRADRTNRLWTFLLLSASEVAGNRRLTGPAPLAGSASTCELIAGIPPARVRRMTLQPHPPRSQALTTRAQPAPRGERPVIIPAG